MYHRDPQIMLHRYSYMCVPKSRQELLLPFFVERHEKSIAKNVLCGIRRGPENIVPRVFCCSKEAEQAACEVAPIGPHVLSPESVGDNNDSNEREEHATVCDVECTALAVALRAAHDTVECCEERKELYAYPPIVWVSGIRWEENWMTTHHKGSRE
jgi:hypothetical protein